MKRKVKTKGQEKKSKKQKRSEQWLTLYERITKYKNSNEQITFQFTSDDVIKKRKESNEKLKIWFQKLLDLKNTMPFYDVISKCNNIIKTKKVHGLIHDNFMDQFEHNGQRIDPLKTTNFQPAFRKLLKCPELLGVIFKFLTTGWSKNDYFTNISTGFSIVLKGLIVSDVEVNLTIMKKNLSFQNMTKFSLYSLNVVHLPYNLVCAPNIKDIRIDVYRWHEPDKKLLFKQIEYFGYLSKMNPNSDGINLDFSHLGGFVDFITNEYIDYSIMKIKSMTIRMSSFYVVGAKMHKYWFAYLPDNVELNIIGDHCCASVATNAFISTLQPYNGFGDPLKKKTITLAQKKKLCKLDKSKKIEFDKELLIKMCKERNIRLLDGFKQCFAAE